MIDIKRFQYTGRYVAPFRLGCGRHSKNILLVNGPGPQWVKDSNPENKWGRPQYLCNEDTRRPDMFLQIPEGTWVEIIRPHNHWEEDLSGMEAEAFATFQIERGGANEEWRLFWPDMLILAPPK